MLLLSQIRETVQSHSSKQDIKYHCKSKGSTCDRIAILGIMFCKALAYTFATAHGLTTGSCKTRQGTQLFALGSRS